MPGKSRGIKGRYFAEIIFLMQLHTQAELAGRAYRRLSIGAKRYNEGITAEDINDPVAPIELVRSAHSFLTHVGIIARLLFLGNRVGKRAKLANPRCKNLRRLLGVTLRDCPALQNLALRHHYEHIDDRLDEQFEAWDGTYLKVNPMQIGSMKVDPGLLTLHRVDPATLEIGFHNDVIETKLLWREIQDLQSLINPAFAKLKNTRRKPLYGP